MSIWWPETETRDVLSSSDMPTSSDNNDDDDDDDNGDIGSAIVSSEWATDGLLCIDSLPGRLL